MVQGGDPLGTGKGGESIWGGPFPDEFHPDNKHDRRGVVSVSIILHHVLFYQLRVADMGISPKSVHTEQKQQTTTTVQR